MKEPAIGNYRDADGAEHELVVRETADSGWHVLDRGGRWPESSDHRPSALHQAE